MQFPLAPSPPGMWAACRPKPRAHAGQGQGDVPSQARWAGSQLQPGSRKGRHSKRPLSLLVLGMDTLENGRVITEALGAVWDPSHG